MFDPETGIFEVATGVDGTVLLAQIERGEWWLHLRFKGDWSVGKYKAMLRSLMELLTYLEDRDVDWVYTIIPKGNPLLLKFERMFGFEEIAQVQDHILLRRSTWQRPLSTS